MIATGAPFEMRRWRIDFFLMLGIVTLNFAYQLFRHDLVTAGDGFGWDGVLYGRIASDLSVIFADLGERAQRVLPSVVAHGVLALFRMDATNANVILVFQLLNFVLLLSALLAYQLVATFENLRPATRWIGYFAIFFVFPSAKNAFYNPVGTDVFALTLSVWLAFRSACLLLVSWRHSRGLRCSRGSPVCSYSSQSRCHTTSLSSG